MKRRFWLYLLVILLVAVTGILAFYPAKQNNNDNSLEVLQNARVEINEPILADFSYTLEKKEGFLNVQTTTGCARYERYILTNKEVLPGCFKYKIEMTTPNGDKCFVDDEREVCVKPNNKEIINLEMRYGLCERNNSVCSNITGNYSIYPIITYSPRIARNV